MSTEVPLANIGDEWNDFTDHQNSNDNLSKSISRSNKSKGESSADCILDLDGEEDDEDIVSYTESETKAAERPILSDNALVCDSIQELVQNFDEQIINCFTDYDQPIEQLAPVQVLNQDELINECQ